eukprot:4152770-Prymnesium_polylepis.6
MSSTHVGGLGDAAGAAGGSGDRGGAGGGNGGRGGVPDIAGHHMRASDTMGAGRSGACLFRRPASSSMVKAYWKSITSLILPWKAVSSNDSPLPIYRFRRGTSAGRATFPEATSAPSQKIDALPSEA